jgi:hypothetical protein
LDTANSANRKPLPGGFVYPTNVISIALAVGDELLLLLRITTKTIATSAENSAYRLPRVLMALVASHCYCAADHNECVHG